MNATDFWWGVGDCLDSILSFIYDENNMITTVFNTTVLFGGFFGVLYWLNLQNKFNKKAKDDKNQIK
ncbi:MAG: hypothetical protein M9916_07930 [Crocinitomicaceae bacterium]|nr:hypothetical protein [Crocinitomicaceae bacterium]